MRIGLHARNDVRFTETDYTAIRTARIETLKIMDFTELAALQRVRAENPGMEFIARLYDDRMSTGHSHPTPQQFIDRFVPRINSLRPYAVKFEIHNEPNHAAGIEGWGPSDGDAQDFRQWYLVVLGGLKQACPWASFGFPGLALNYPHRDLEWLAICRDAVQASHWLGCHTYWQYGNMLSQEWGLRFIQYRSRFPDKTIEITEFGNSTPGISRNEMAQQYATYYPALQQYPYLASASSFICSSPDSTWEPFAWCNGASGVIYPVVYAVGALPHTPPPVAPSYRVAYLSHTTPASMAAGQRVRVTMRIRNDGNVVWKAGGQQPVHLGYHWYDSAGAIAPAWEDIRSDLPGDVAPGAAVTVQAEVGAPAAPGQYVLKWDMVEEGVAWFAWRGAATLDVPVNVPSVQPPAPAWRASASINGGDAPYAIDGNMQTAWSSQASQQPGMWFMLDLGLEQALSGVRMDSPGKDFPRGYRLEASSDGQTWRHIVSKDPNWSALDVSFAPVPARYLRITQTRTPRWPVNWSISEISLDSASVWRASASPNPQDAAKAIDGDVGTAWSTLAAQRPGAWFQLDLGQQLYVDRVLLDNTANPRYPRGYVMRVSLDGQTWQDVSRRVSNWAPVDVSVGPRWVRYLHIENTGSSPWHPWAIAEITLIQATPP